jgi:hypothetical protein
MWDEEGGGFSIARDDPVVVGHLSHTNVRLNCEASRPLRRWLRRW